MSPKKIRWLVICLIGILGAAGCKCNNTAIETFEIVADNPALSLVVSTLNPTFEWTANKSCDPDRFGISIFEDVEYGGDGHYQESAFDAVPYTLSGDSLLPGRSYYWHVNAQNSWTSGSPGATGPNSDDAHFYTGPVCTGETLIAPELDVPLAYGSSYKAEIDNWITHDHLQVFKWTYKGGCLPLMYDYQFATDPGFSDIILTGTTTTPYNQSIHQTFPNCSTIFWRVAANDGSVVGPWSDTRQFHWVREGTDCWQTNYISDDAATINVRLFSDQCSQTGYNASTTVLSDPLCIGDGGSNMIVADGVKGPVDYSLGDYVVDLGSGPCPSVGLDQKLAKKLPFNVLAPGTYCVSISRDQILDDYGINLMDGVWSEPRTNAVVAEQTVEIGPGNSDFMVEFGWDEYDLVFVMPPFDFTMECRFCPDPLGPVTGYLFAEQPVPIFGRDFQSNWKLSEVEGMACYALISDVLLDKALANIPGQELRSIDLGQYPPPPPCPEPDKPVTNQKTCSDYATRTDCSAHSGDGCKWNANTNSCDGP